MWCSGSYC
jgi:hypothetical protein